MKKMIIATLSVITLSSLSSFAGLGGFDSNHFNEMINESIKAEKEIRQEVRNNAGFKQAEKRRILAVKEIEGSGTRVVNVTSEPFIKLQKTKPSKDRLKLERKNFDRISLELNDAN